MPDKPLLLLPRSEPMPREIIRGMFNSNLRRPGRADQGDRIGPQLTTLLDAFVTDSPTGISTENILVLETAGRTENFRTAVNAVPGLKWLSEIDQDEVDADAQFFERPKIGSRFFKDRLFALDARESREIVTALTANGILDRSGILQEEATDDLIRSAVPQDFSEYAEKIIEAINREKDNPLPGRMFLSLSNRQTLQEIKTMFDRWAQGEQLRYGAGAWGEIFFNLRTVRFWNAKDRVSDTGILDYWQKEVACKQGTMSKIAFEIELSYADDKNCRQLRQQHVEELVARERGNIIASCDIEEIHFHAIKVELPVENIEHVLGEDYSALFEDGSILYFRPTPQCALELYADGSLEDIESTQVPDGNPIVAILDGMPFSRHKLLDGFVILDDPEDFASDYLPREMNHCTAMLSLICHGELDAGGHQISRKVYVRPILRPDVDSPLTRRPEQIPKDLFFEDLVEQAVRRMFISISNEPAAAPTVKFINLSVADPYRMFNRIPGPTARLLDWLSYKYKILFFVSAGNITDTIQLGLDPDELSAIADNDKISIALASMFRDKRNRRIFSPSESINSITVGAQHDDASPPILPDGCVDILPSTALPSPLSPLGHGFRSSIKPDIIVPGGRQFFTYIGDGEYDLPRIQPRSGQKVAAVPISPGDRTRTIYTCGTSNANALAVRGASFIHDAVLEVLEEQGVDNYDDSIAALIKALLVHGASWGNAAEVIGNVLRVGKASSELKKEIARCLGYGFPNFSRSIECAATRATAIGLGVIAKDQRHEYQLPLPPSMSGLDCWRRLTITLAWLSPINVDNRKYRKAALAFEATNAAENVGGKRIEAQWQQVRNGTLQHEIIEGAQVRAFQEGAFLLIPVQCREDAGPLDVDVPYGLAVSLEVKEEVDIPVYEEIQALIAVSVRETIRVA